ncbi:MAG: molybdenum cofactor biosynthesis protein [Candidatus Thorarchaeota archaeon]|nr:MAG: molybdenum cofactor biosynthesis protein [Candidatus Thorarchaeota archaeon]
MTDEHRRDQKVATGFAILTVSDSRTKESDKSGQLAQELITTEGHTIVEYDLVPNKEDAIKEKTRSYLDNDEIRVIVTSGGTGVGRRDVTVRTLVPMFEKRLDGFGEYFRQISFKEIGIAGIYSQASAGLIGKTIVYCLPGSKNAMATALTRIILPGLGHLLWEVDR